jgi:hypothetical protein
LEGPEVSFPATQRSTGAPSFAFFAKGGAVKSHTSTSHNRHTGTQQANTSLWLLFPGMFFESANLLSEASYMSTLSFAGRKPLRLSSQA